MIAIDNTIVSEHLLEKKFVCDLNACKGECCVAGDSGAPLEKEEIAIMEEIWDKVKPYLPKDGVKAIEKQGQFVIDDDGDYTTPTCRKKENIVPLPFLIRELPNAVLNKLIMMEKSLGKNLFPVTFIRCVLQNIKIMML